MPRKRLIDPSFKLSKERIELIKSRPERRTTFNNINEKMIIEKNNLIKQHLGRLNKIKARMKSPELSRIKQLIELIDNPSTNAKIPEKPNPQKINPEQKNRGLRVLINEKKRIIEVIKNGKIYEKLKKHAKSITSILTHYKTKLQVLEENKSDLINRKYYLKDYTHKINAVKMGDSIEKLVNSKNLPNLIKMNSNIENLILNKAKEMQSTFPTRNTRKPITPIIIEEIKKELFVTDNQIITRIGNLKKLDKSDSEIISETLNFVKFTLSNNISKRISEIEKEINKLKPVIEEYKQEISKKDVGNKRLEDIYIHMRKITSMYPELIDENVTTLKQKLDNTSKELNLAMQKSKTRVVINPKEQATPKTDLDTHITQRNKAIILSKIERELYKFIKKYDLNN